MNKYIVNNSEELFSAVEAMKKSSGDTEIFLNEGIYFIDRTISIENMKNVSITSQGKTRLVGGKTVRDYSFVSEICPDTAGRFDESIRDKVLCSDLGLSGISISDTGTFGSRGFGRPESPSHSEIFINTKPMNLSQYPKKGEFLKITGFETPESDEGWGNVNGKLSDGFYYNDDRPKSWLKSDSIITHGYWGYDWANSYETIDILDSDKMFVRNKPPYGNYQFHTGQRFCFLNILEEVRYPGDYFIDRSGDSPILYFIPFDDENPDEILVSILKDPIIDVSGSEKVSISGVVIECGCGNGIRVDSSVDVTVDFCIIRNIGNSGIKVTSSKSVNITNNVIHDIGDNAAYLSGGNSETLERADYLFENNHVYFIAKWTRCYVCAALLSGVGMTARHNTIHDCPHTAIFFNGNEMEVTDNEIYSVVLETGDAGAIYAGRRYEWRGNNISRNFIHHLGGVGMGTMGIYNDDCLSGTKMEGNWFWRCSRAAFIGGGRGFSVRDNVFVDCYPSIPIDGRGASPHIVWRNMVTGYMKDQFMKALSYKDEKGNSVYLKQYPELQEIIDFYESEEKPLIPPSAVISGNVFSSDQKISLDWESEYGDITITKNHKAWKDDFYDFDFGDFRLKSDSEAIRRKASPYDLSKSGADSKRLAQRFADVYASLDLSENRKKLTLRIKNRGDCEESGVYTIISDNKENSVSGYKIEFTVSHNSVSEYTINLSNSLEKNEKIQAVSCLAGARPAVL